MRKELLIIGCLATLLAGIAVTKTLELSYTKKHLIALNAELDSFRVMVQSLNNHADKLEQKIVDMEEQDRLLKELRRGR